MRCLSWSNLVFKTDNLHCIKHQNESFCIIPDIKPNIRICHLWSHYTKSVVGTVGFRSGICGWRGRCLDEGESCGSVDCVCSARNDGRVRPCGIFFHSKLIKHTHRIKPRAASARLGKVLGQQVPGQGRGQLAAPRVSWEWQLWAVTPGPRLSLGPGAGSSRAATGRTGMKQFVSHLGEAQLQQI